MVSAEEGSVWPLKVTLAVLPCVTGPLLVKVAVGATLVMVSVVAVDVMTAEPAVTRTRTLDESGPSPRPMEARVAARDGGVGAGGVVVLAVAVDVPLVGGADRLGWSSRTG